MEQKQKNLSLKLLLISFLFLFSFGVVAAANTATLERPAQDASISGSSYVLNATLDTNTLNLTLATFLYDDGSSNTTINANVSNVTNTLFNTTWDTTALVDIDDYTIWVEVTNETYAVQTRDSSTGVDIDNGNPTATLSSSTFSTEDELGFDESFTIGLDADSTIGISSCKVYYTNEITDEVTVQSVSASANACSTSTDASSQSLEKGDGYNVVIEATDGNGDKTNSSTRILRITSSGGGGGVKQTYAPGQEISTKARNLGETIRNSLENIPSTISNFVNSVFDTIKNLFN